MQNFTLTLGSDQPLALGDKVSHRVSGSFAGPTRCVHAVGRSVGRGSWFPPFPKTKRVALWTPNSCAQNVADFHVISCCSTKIGLFYMRKSYLRRHCTEFFATSTHHVAGYSGIYHRSAKNSVARGINVYTQ